MTISRGDLSSSHTLQTRRNLENLIEADRSADSISQTMTKLHQRQFLLGPVATEREGWAYIRLKGGWVLSHCGSLEVGTTTDLIGREWTLLGLAVQTQQGEPDPVAALQQGFDNIADITRTWTGRWLLIGEEEIHLDASGLLACFYRKIDSGSNAGAWVSSSVALLADIPGSPPPGTAQAELSYAVGIDWFPPPRSRYPGIRRVLASQTLVLSNGDVRPKRRLTFQPLDSKLSTEALLKTVENRLITGMRNLARVSVRPLWIALTAGIDSRTVLAAAHAAGVDAQAYTQELPFYRWGQGLADRNLPPRLAKEIGLNHTLIKAEPRSDDLIELWDHHTAGQIVEADREFVARGQWEAIPAGTTVIRAGVLEVVQNTDYPYLPPLSGERQQMLAALVSYGSGFGRAPTEYQRAGLSEWLDSLTHEPETGVDWRTRFYHEQRVSGWLSSIEQGLDCTNRRSIQFANCNALLEELITFDSEIRTAVDHQWLLIDRMAPELLRHPINPEDNTVVKLAGKVVREFHRMADPGDEGGYLKNLAHRLRRILHAPTLDKG